MGTIANFYPAKDIDNLVLAAARVADNVRFVVIGQGTERSELERRIIAHGLENRFFLVGGLPEAAKYIPAFDVFALPSKKEGFPFRRINTSNYAIIYWSNSITKTLSSIT